MNYNEKALLTLKKVESWWRLRNDQRTIKAFEPAMSEVLDAIEELSKPHVAGLMDSSVDLYWCDCCEELTDNKSHRCEQWSHLDHIPVKAQKALFARQGNP